MQKEIRRNTIDFAIDFGTSDSVIACFNGQNSRIIKNHSTGENFTPSAIYIDDSEKIHIGKIAKEAVLKDPTNAITEFKVNLGFPIPFLFEKSNKKMFPEQLSAEVLKDLKKSIHVDSGKNIEEVVITVPANSNPLKTKSTKEAAKLAGFKSIYLILEPVAAAIAYGLNTKKQSNGIWMVYDLGGGTFDVSLVKTNNGEIEILTTSGEDNLGGKLFDWKIVNDYFKPKIINDLNLKDFNQNNPKYLKIFSILKNEAEKAKISLSNLKIESNKYQVDIPNLIKINNTNYDFKYTLTKNDLINIMKPFLKTTFNHCYEILDEKNLDINDVEKIILVGGSTLSTIIRDNLKLEFNRQLEYSINPLTVVAQGASIYAGTIEKQFKKPKNNKFALILDYENMGLKDNIYVQGKVFSLDSNFSFLDYHIEIIDTHNEESVKILDLDIDGNFKLNLSVSNEYNEFLINIYNDKNQLIKLDEKSTNSINYRKAINPGNNVLTSSINLYLSEDSSLILEKFYKKPVELRSKNQYITDYTQKLISSQVIVPKGEKLECNKKEVLYTNSVIKKGDNDSFIKLLFYSGEFKIATYNTFLGEIIISGLDIMDDLPKKSKIELNTHINNSNLISFEVFIPYLRQSFTNSFSFNNYKTYNNFLSNPNDLKDMYDDLIQKYNIIKDFISNNNENESSIGKNYLEIYKNIEEIEEKEIINYLDILINIAKYDKIAIYPALDYLNYLNNILDELIFFFNMTGVDCGV